MKTPEELTALTLDFLGEHTNEAALAVALGIVWHLVWERPKHLTNVPEPQNVAPIEPIPGSKKIQSQLRGNLKNELQIVLRENEQLERIVSDLRSEIERNDEFQGDLFHYSPTAAYRPLGMASSRKRIRNPGLIRTTVGMATNELDILGSCWTLLVFGFCLVSTRSRRKRDNPLSATFVMLEKLYIKTNAYTQKDVVPALSKIRIYLGNELQERYAQIIDPASDSGKAIANIREFCKIYSKTTLEWTENTVLERLLPLASQLANQGIEYSHHVVNTLSHLEIEMPKWKKSLPTVLLSEHEGTVKTIQDSLNKEETERRALQEKIGGLERALRGKEVLLYEERMKTRSAKLQSAQVLVERDEIRCQVRQDTEKAALAAVAEDKWRLLQSFLNEHLLSRHYQERLALIDEKGNPKKSAIVLPDPILQGFASAMYINNLSSLSSDHTTPSQRQQRLVSAGDIVTDCRDDAGVEDEYYGNPNEVRLSEIKEQFLRSKIVSNILRPSYPDPRNGNQASTGSLLWSAANPATKAKEGTATKKLAMRAPVPQQQPSSWMEDPASIMCDWRTSEDEVRE